MSFIIKRRTAAEYNTFAAVEWPSHLLAIMNGFDAPLSGVTAMALRPIFSDDFILDSFYQADVHLPSEFVFVKNAATTSRYLSDEAFHKCLNFMWQCLNEDDRFMPYVPSPSVSEPPRSAPAPLSSDGRRDPRFAKVYNCNGCKNDVTGLDNLYAHHIAIHDGKWAWPKLKALVGDVQAKALVDDLLSKKASVEVGYPAPKPEPVVPTYTGGGDPFARKGGMTFTMEQKVDLRSWPDGRYALRGVGGEAFFIIKRTVKRPYTRRGRFVWGATTHAWTTVKVGVIELRKQIGDTKELIGEQRPDEDFYRGEMGEVIEQIAADLPGALSLYGILMNKCAYCGRSLTDKLSRLRGIGPDCYEEKHVHVLRSKIDAAMRAAAKP